MRPADRTHRERGLSIPRQRAESGVRPSSRRSKLGGIPSQRATDNAFQATSQRPARLSRGAHHAPNARSGVPRAPRSRRVLPQVRGTAVACQCGTGVPIEPEARRWMDGCNPRTVGRPTEAERTPLTHCRSEREGGTACRERYGTWAEHRIIEPPSSSEHQPIRVASPPSHRVVVCPSAEGPAGPAVKCVRQGPRVPTPDRRDPPTGRGESEMLTTRSQQPVVWSSLWTQNESRTEPPSSPHEGRTWGQRTDPPGPQRGDDEGDLAPHPTAAAARGDGTPRASGPTVAVAVCALCLTRQRQHPPSPPPPGGGGAKEQTKRGPTREQQRPVTPPPGGRRCSEHGTARAGRRRIWLILPAVICFVQGLSHACLRARGATVDL